MQIVVNEQLKEAIEWTCKYANEYKVDIDIHIDADGEVSVSVCPTYRDRDTADTPQTDWEKEKSEKSLCNSCEKDCDNRKRNLYVVECNRYEPQTDCGWK